MDCASSAVVINAFAATPASIGEEQSSDEPDFTIGGGIGSELCAVRFTVPGEVTFVPTLSLVHVGLCPFPETVELFLLV